MRELSRQYRFDATGAGLLPKLQSEQTALDTAIASLAPDPYLKTSRRQTGLVTARYIRKREGGWEREILDQEPYVQRSDMSPVGKMEREYLPYEGILADTADQVMQHTLMTFPNFYPRNVYDVNMFAFRITGEQGQPGSPAVEGGHYDGDERNLLFVLSRQNVHPDTGETTLFKYGQQNAPYFRKTLQSGDLVTWNDRWKKGLWHNTTPVTPEDPTEVAIRDVFDFGINPAPVKERLLYQLRPTRR